MKVAFASVYHPQLNGVVKKANCLIFQAMKKILEGEERKMSRGHASSSMES
jgi:hypothetical protein